MSDVNHILRELSADSTTDAEILLPLVYDELRCLAARRLSSENPGQTLDATGLVHEVYLRLFGTHANSSTFQSRGHFLAAAAQGMRRILIDRARRKNSQKRGGDLKRCDLEVADISIPVPDDELLALHESLDRLAELDPQKARLVELRFFVGLTNLEAARVLDISPSTADRYWVYARAWLQTAIRET